MKKEAKKLPMVMRAKNPSARTIKRFLVKRKSVLFKAVAKARDMLIYRKRLKIEDQLGTHPKYRHSAARKRMRNTPERWEQRYMELAQKATRKVKAEKVAA